MSLIPATVQTDGIAALSYLIGDDKTGTAAVIDPRSAVEIYLEPANKRKISITHIFETHIHAELVSGSRELADRVKTARICVSVEGGAKNGFDHESHTHSARGPVVTPVRILRKAKRSAAPPTVRHHHI